MAEVEPVDLCILLCITYNESMPGANCLIVPIFLAALITSARKEGVLTTNTAVGPQLQTVTLDKPQGRLFCNLSYDN